MSRIILKPINSFMLPSTKENEKNNFYLSGILLEQDKKAFALKVNKQNGFYYTFDMSTINDTFIISKDDTLIFQIFKKFLEQILSKYYLDMDDFAKRSIPTNFITKDKKGNISINFISDLDIIKNIISFTYTEQGILIKTSSTNELCYSGIEINSNGSKYANFFVEIQNLLDNLYDLFNEKNNKEVKKEYRVTEEFTINPLNNGMIFSKNNQNLSITKENNDIVVNIDNANKADLTFNIARKPLNIEENKIYQILIIFFKHLFSEAILDKKSNYPPDFINYKNKSITIKNATGDTLIIKYSFDKISLNLTMGQRDKEALDILAKYFGEANYELERKMTISSKSYAYPTLNYEFQILLNELINVYNNQMNKANTLKRRR